MSRALTPDQVLEALGGDTEGLKALGSAAYRVSKALSEGRIPEVSNIRLSSGSEVQNLDAFAQGTLRNLARNLSNLREIDQIISARKDTHQ